MNSWKLVIVQVAAAILCWTWLSRCMLSIISQDFLLPTWNEIKCRKKKKKKKGEVNIKDEKLHSKVKKW